MTSSSSHVKVVVVGGSYAGINVIKTLLSSTSKKPLQITLVERNEARHHSMGAFRALVDPEYGDKIWVPYTNLFPKGSPHKIVRDTLSQVHDHHIILSSGQTVEFDYLVLCTGSRNPAPAKFGHVASTADAVAITNKARAELTKSKSVVILGGGACGVELAGEIKTAYPEKKVTLVQATSSLVDYPGFSQAFGASAQKHLQKLGVNVVLNERPTVEGLDINNPIQSKLVSIRTKSGEVIESDLQFLSVGITVDTSYISTLKPAGVVDFDSSSLINKERKVIKIQKTMQLADPNFPYIFAVGDCTDFSEVPMAAACSFTGPVAAKNLLLLIELAPSNSPSVKDVQAAQKKAKFGKGSMPAGLMLLATGPTTGVSSLPLFGTRFGNFFAKMLKSKDLMIGNVVSEMQIPK
ncbi:hypothetical protein BGZ83_007072 [Gryganskiella cystojenkinii]|nr:hypothetical protein BGZ83_007072 [Gryganskiella cystojenkinii]